MCLTLCGSQSKGTDLGIKTIRPYQPTDLQSVYMVCLKTGNSGLDGTHLFPKYPNAIGERYVGGYVTLPGTIAYVLEDATGVCGYVLAAIDSKPFYDAFRSDWLPAVAAKYSRSPGLLASAILGRRSPR
eukprot:m.463095 g.463095  ORF g.463095 m.463095 type:complete len:129 (+) comp57029_c0_seq6:353-739(+)